MLHYSWPQPRKNNSVLGDKYDDSEYIIEGSDRYKSNQ